MNNTMTFDYTIEYSHIYMDEVFSLDHKNSIPILHNVEKLLSKKGLSHSRTIMIDDYNPKKYILSIDNFLKEVSSLNAYPDNLLMESEMVYWVHDLLERANGRIKKSYVRYLNKKGHYPCSLLLTISHLVKLGYYSHPFNGSSYLGNPSDANRTIVILPNKYASVEEQGLELLHSANLDDYIRKIEHIFY